VRHDFERQQPEFPAPRRLGAAMTPPRGLTEAEAKHFLDKGYVSLKGCFTKEAAEPWITAAYKRLGCDPRDPKTWKKSRTALPVSQNVIVGDFAPRVWEAICGLVGGEERTLGRHTQSWSDSFIVQFPCGRAAPAFSRDRAWHKDGEDLQFLDSPLGLFMYVYWSDAAPGGGGAFIVPDSLGPVARHWAEHPEGADKQKLDTSSIISSCKEFVELTGSVGDVILVHPNMLHAESDNAAGPPFFFTTRGVELGAPLDFNRKNKSEFSLVESVVLKSLGVERLDFKRR
jgi:hypothetical protein